jgi:hypothetical protein
MARSFDPYHKWLGIQPEEQPPNHYRLLGIALFESDADVIASAADQRMAHVRMFQSGKYSELSQRILNEIAAARVCLLNREKKAQYDAELNQAVAAAEPPASAESAVSSAIVLPFATDEPEPEPAFLAGLPESPVEPAPAAVANESPLDLGFGLSSPAQTAAPRRAAASTTYRRPTRAKKSSAWLPFAIIGGGIGVVAIVVLIVINLPADPGTQKPQAAQRTADTKTSKTSLHEKTDSRSRGDSGTQTEKPKVETKTSVGHEKTEDEPAKTIEKKTEKEPPKPSREEIEAAELAKAYPATAEGGLLVNSRLAEAKTPEDYQAVAKAGMSVLSRAEAAGNRELATSVAGWALSAARRTEDPSLVREVTLRILQFQGKTKGRSGPAKPIPLPKLEEVNTSKDDRGTDKDDRETEGPGNKLIE